MKHLLKAILTLLVWLSPLTLAITASAKASALTPSSIVSHTSSETQTAPSEIIAAIHLDTFEKYELSKYDDICHSFNPKAYDQVYRIIVELMILCEAMLAVDYSPKITFIPSPNYSRSLKFVESGAAHTLIDSVWTDDIKRFKFRATEPVLHAGEFEKGLFTTPDHPLLTSKNLREDLASSFAVTFKNWQYDRAILEGLTENVVYTNTFDSLFKMLYAKRVDFTLLEFPYNENQTFILNGEILSCIQGVKVLIHEARAFVVSETAPNAGDFFNVLKKGLNILRQKGRIRALYVQYGIVNSSVTDWELLNPIPTSTQTTKHPNR